MTVNVSPLSWQDTVFGNRTALLDFAGTHMIQHQQLDARILALVPGAPVKRWPIGDLLKTPPGFGREEPETAEGEGGVEVSDEWLKAHQQMHESEADALGATQPPDLTSYDLTVKDQWNAFHQIHAQHHLVLNAAAGLQ